MSIGYQVSIEIIENFSDEDLAYPSDEEDAKICAIELLLDLIEQNGIENYCKIKINNVERED